MRSLFTILLMITSFAGQAQEVRGLVMNLVGQPLKGTVISITGQDNSLLSGETGEFSFDLDEDLDSSFGFVILRHPEYAELRIPLQEFRGTTGRLSVMLDTKLRNCRHVIQ